MLVLFPVKDGKFSTGANAQGFLNVSSIIKKLPYKTTCINSTSIWVVLNDADNADDTENADEG